MWFTHRLCPVILLGESNITGLCCLKMLLVVRWPFTVPDLEWEKPVLPAKLTDRQMDGQRGDNRIILWWLWFTDLNYSVHGVAHSYISPCQRELKLQEFKVTLMLSCKCPQLCMVSTFISPLTLLCLVSTAGQGLLITLFTMRGNI